MDPTPVALLDDAFHIDTVSRGGPTNWRPHQHEPAKSGGERDAKMATSVSRASQQVRTYCASSAVSNICSPGRW